MRYWDILDSPILSIRCVVTSGFGKCQFVLRENDRSWHHCNLSLETLQPCSAKWWALQIFPP
ncbi:unnamed protein product [Staurois parvus]|uniref:Uncharacterized protein n=1 Tax=Staurois parvus TaxID=386267 RepID=A0ABN9FIR7_9NEOB|nr:unnamed protein product [Staurois parvus]